MARPRILDQCFGGLAHADLLRGRVQALGFSRTPKP